MILLVFACWLLTSVARVSARALDRLLPRPEAALVEVRTAARP